MRASSADLRGRVLRAVDAGENRADILRLFGISRAPLKRSLKQRRETGTIAAKAHPGRPRRQVGPLAGSPAKAAVPEHDDATLATHGQRWREQSGEELSQSTMRRAIRKLGPTAKKKTMGATERDQQARAIWQEQQACQDAEKLVVLDACGSNIGLTPLNARAAKGKRAHGSAPRNRGKHTTLIASVTWSGMGPAMLIEGGANAVAFEK